MAQAYLYQYKGEFLTKQNKFITDMPLDKARIWLDFNELCAIDKNTEASVYDEDFDTFDMPNAILADGIVIRNYLEQYPRVRWLIRLKKHHMNYTSGDEYVYWMSDL